MFNLKRRMLNMLKVWFLAGSVMMAISMKVKVMADPPKISGFVDTTYNYDMNRPASRITAMRSFDRKTDSFLLNAAQVNIEGSKEGIGYLAKLAFGTDPSIYKSVGTGADAGLPTAPSSVAYNFEVMEAYLTYKCPKTSVQFKAGKFVTFEGIEVIESKDNFTITRGHLFGLAEPYTHVGAIAGYAFPKVVELWVGAVNGWDLHTDNNIGKTFLSKLGLNLSDQVTGSFSFYRGAEKTDNTNDARTSVDTTWFIKPSGKLTLALQANAGEEEKFSFADKDGDGIADGGAGHWYGVSIQPLISITDKFGIGGRYEWFSDLDGARHPGNMTHIIQNITLTPTFNITESLMFRVEYRYDWSTAQVFEGSDGLTNKSIAKTLSSELIFKF